MRTVAFAAEKVDQSNLPEWAGGWTHINPDPNGQARMWQTFTPDYSNITAVEIDILTVNAGDFDDIITVEIAKDGEMLASVERNVEYGYEGLIRFDFAEAVAVVPGELYELKVHETGLTRFGWRYASNTYDAGSRYVSATERPGTDWFFQTYSLEPRIIYVDDDAAGANDGTSWENAYVYLQDALADANSSEKPIEIRVAQGIYTPDQGRGIQMGDRTATFSLINGLTIKGGFAGIGEANPDARDVELYETILSGDINGDDNLPWTSYSDENSYHVVTGGYKNNTAVIDGFTIKDGYICESVNVIHVGRRVPSQPDSIVVFGAGMYNEHGSPTVRNCSFTGNHASDTSYSTGGGAGMYNYNQSNPKVINCIFNSNIGEKGAGMYNDANSCPKLTNCIFTNNEAHTEGGGIYNDANSCPVLNNCEFKNNEASHNGGGMYNLDSEPYLINCVFSGNTVRFSGGGMYNRKSSPILTSCIFRENITTESRDGAGMYNESSSPALMTCVFERNDAQGFSSMCNEHSNSMLIGCMFRSNIGSGIENTGDIVLRNCIFEGNSGGRAGGLFHHSIGSCTLENCTFVGNISLSCAHCAGGLWTSESNETTLVNCIFWDNSPTQIEGWPTVLYSNIQGGYTNTPLSKRNIDVEPSFVNAGYWANGNDPNIIVEPNDPNTVWVDGDYHLKSQAGRWDPNSQSWVIDDVTSPCIDAGDPNSVIGDEPEPNGGRINMGAYGGTVEASKSPAFSWFFETTQGPVLFKGLGIVLPHEHIFTDLRGPTTPGYGQADAADVVRVMAPLLTDAHDKGVGVLIECSSIGVGRNVPIIAQVAEASGLPVVVPTGVYGRANFAPSEHRNMTEDELTALFISEIQDGIEGTEIRAGFIKISTDSGPMNALIERILRAAGRAASETGAAIASHTPTGSNAIRQVDILESIDPAIRFIWVHAQNESNRNIHLQLAARGAYIEFDSLGWNPGQDSTYISSVKNLLAAGYGDRILLSHDAGWYQPGSANGGTQKPYTYLIDTFIPKLRDAGVDDATIRMITRINPVRAFGFKSEE